jgi:hypothetical protein
MTSSSSSCAFPGCGRIGSLRCSRCHVMTFCSAVHQNACWNSSSALHYAICHEPKGHVTITTADDGTSAPISHQGRLSNICVPGSEINIVLIDKTVYDVKCGSCRRSVARENPPAALDIDLGAGDSVLGALLFDRVKMSVVELGGGGGGGGGGAPPPTPPERQEFITSNVPFECSIDANRLEPLLHTLCPS